MKNKNMKTRWKGNTEEWDGEGREKRKEIKEGKGGEDMKLWKGTAPATQKRET